MLGYSENSISFEIKKVLKDYYEECDGYLMYKNMTTTTDPYVDIRPYNDDEIPAAIDRLINDEEFIAAILQHRFDKRSAWLKSMLSPFVKVYLKFK